MEQVSTSANVRHPAVAGLFYPDDPEALRAVISQLLTSARTNTNLRTPPKALIVPHAGYPYSGPVAAAAYSLIEPLHNRIKRVVVVGPSHRHYLRGIALPQATFFATPLGEIPIDKQGRDILLRRGDVLASDSPHELEHCLEVQLPFLQTVLDDFTLVPLVVGDVQAAQVASVLNDVWGASDSLVLASSDLSHYLTYDAAREIDATTATAIVNRHTDITHHQACGAAGINGLLQVALELGLEVTEIARQNSGDTAGDTKRVVGYGAFAIHESRHQPS